MFSMQNLKVYTNQRQNRKQIKIRKEISMTIEIKYNVGDKIKRPRNCFATTSHSGSSSEQILRVERIIIERRNAFNGWKTKFSYECQDERTGNFVTLSDDEIDKCSSIE